MTKKTEINNEEKKEKKKEKKKISPSDAHI